MIQKCWLPFVYMLYNSFSLQETRSIKTVSHLLANVNCSLIMTLLLIQSFNKSSLFYSLTIIIYSLLVEKWKSARENEQMFTWWYILGPWQRNTSWKIHICDRIQQKQKVTFAWIFFLLFGLCYVFMKRFNLFFRFHNNFCPTSVIFFRTFFVCLPRVWEA